jgi:hypothetical protein
MLNPKVFCSLNYEKVVSFHMLVNIKRVIFQERVARSKDEVPKGLKLLMFNTMVLFER